MQDHANSGRTSLTTGRLTFTATGPWTAEYALREARPATRLAILLHGYAQSYRALFPKLDPVLPRDWTVLALSGPFPLPKKLPEGGYRAAYAWYFYDDATDEYLVDQDLALEFVAGAVKSLGLDELPKTLIGFSQGGYMAPCLGERLTRVDHVIGIGCRFLDEEIQGTPPFRLDGIHGADDAVISAAASRDSWEKLQARGIRGEFRVLPGIGHQVSTEVVALVRELAFRAVS